MKVAQILLFSFLFSLSHNSFGESIVTPSTSDCKIDNEKRRLVGIIEWVEFECDEAGECGVAIKVPNIVEGAEFEALALIKDNDEQLEFLSRLPVTVSDEGGHSFATILGTEKFLKNFYVRALYNNNTSCLLFSDRPLEKDGS